MPFNYPLLPIYSTPYASQQAAYFTTGELNKILTNLVAAKEYNNKEIYYFYILLEQNIIKAL